MYNMYSTTVYTVYILLYNSIIVLEYPCKLFDSSNLLEYSNHFLEYSCKIVRFLSLNSTLLELQSLTGACLLESIAF